MEIWLIENGEKSGPFPEFEVRSRIRGGDLKGDRKAWHQGLDEWMRLDEIELFDEDFAIFRSPPPIPEQQTPEELVSMWRRFGARWFDWILYQAIFSAVVLAARVDMLSLAVNWWFPFISLLPWVFFEGVMVTTWGTTPGKFLSGLKVRDESEEKLPAMRSLSRALRVMVLGMGFGNPLFLVLCHLFSAWFYTKKKAVLWDTPAGIRVKRIPDKAEKWVGFGILAFVGLMAQGAMSPFILKNSDLSRLPAEQRELIERLFSEEATPEP